MGTANNLSYGSLPFFSVVVRARAHAHTHIHKKGDSSHSFATFVALSSGFPFKLRPIFNDLNNVLSSSDMNDKWLFFFLFPFFPVIKYVFANACTGLLWRKKIMSAPGEATAPLRFKCHCVAKNKDRKSPFYDGGEKSYNCKRPIALSIQISHSHDNISLSFRGMTRERRSRASLALTAQGCLAC